MVEEYGVIKTQKLIISWIATGCAIALMVSGTYMVTNWCIHLAH